MPMTIGGVTYSDQQIKDFYAGGGNDAQFSAANGGTRDQMLQARQIAGGGPTTQTYFDQYQKANPNGAYAGNYQGWMADQAPHRLDAMKSGTYTGDGADQSPTDYYNAYQAGQGGNDYGSSTGSGQTGGMAGGTNPYLKGMGDTIVNQMTDNYTRNQLPAMRSGAMAAGGFGGSRQGVVEANGLRDLNLGIGQNLTNLYGQDWTNSQNRNLQEKSINNSYDLGLKSINNSYDLGLRSSDLGFAGLDANIANSNFNNQLNAANFGLNATNVMNQQTGAWIQAGTDIQNAPLKYQTMFSDQANKAGGQGGTTTGTQTGANNPYANIIGGGMMGYDLYNRYRADTNPQTVNT